MSSASITGGTGGKGGVGGRSAELTGGQGGASGNGGHGIDIYTAGSLFSSISNAGRITGGDGGSGGAGGESGASGGSGGNGANGGVGGDGITAGGKGFTIDNLAGGVISGGNGGAGGNGGTASQGVAGTAGTGGLGGVGVRLKGNGFVLNNAGSIVGGLIGGSASIRARAVDIQGDNNVVELRTGYSFAGNVVADGSDNVLRLGGDADAFFEVSNLKTAEMASYDEFVGFAVFERVGASDWTLTGIDSQNTSWTVKAGSLIGNTDTFRADQSVETGASIIFDQTNAGTYSHNVSGQGGLVKRGGGVLTLTGTNAYAGTTTVESGTLQIGDGGTSGSLASNTVAVAASTELAFNRSDAVTYNGVIYGAGGLSQKGPGSLTLTATNTFTGTTTLTAGTLTLSGNGSIADSSGLSMAGSTVFDISAVTGGNASIAALTVSGTGASVNDSGNGKALTVSGNTITFDISGVNDGETMLSANGTLITTVDTVVVLSGMPSLAQGQAITLVEGVESTGVFTDVLDIRYGRFSYDITRSGLDIILGSNGYVTFREDSDSILNPAGLNNVNIINGSDYLDRLENASLLPADISSAYDLATLGRTQGVAAVALQQLYGGYAAYANQALADDMARFRRRWQGQSRFFFDSRMFADQIAGQAEAGLASGAAFASPRYGARDCVPVGRSRVWVGGFGTWSKQNERSNLPGYKYDSQGAVLGYEYTLGNFNLGVAAAYSRGDLKVNDLRYKNEADFLNLALYGAYIHESGFYAEGGLGYGHAWNDY